MQAHQPDAEATPPVADGGLRTGVAPLGEPSHATIEEIVLCSGAGEALYDWNVGSLQSRLALLAQVEQQAVDLGGLLPLGRFDRLEVRHEGDRIVCQVQPHMRLFVRSAGSPACRE
jgi:hypothetical protein